MKPNEVKNLVWKLFPDTLARKASAGHWKPYPHLKHAAKIIAEGIAKGNLRLIISMPPRHGKSELISFWLPIWFLELWPNKKVIISSYAEELASSFGRRVRNEFEGNELLSTKISQDSSAAHRFNTGQGGGLLATGVGGTMVGKGGNLLIIDDPYKNLEEANSPKHRLRIEQWVDAVARTRLEPGGSMILNMTRWHDKDLAAYLKSKGNFREIVFPAIAEGEDVLGRVKGDPLCADRFNLEALESIKHDIGSYNWNSLYQQNPIPIEGGLFKRHWWKFYDTAPTDGRIVQFWDCAQKVGITNDYSVCTTWMEKNGNFFALDRWKNKVEAPDLQRAVVSNFYAHNADLVVVEDKSSGSSLIQYLKRETMLPLLPYDPGQKDKQVRASSATGLVESGRCFLPSSSNWTEDFILEHERFPNAEHDDQVDTTSMMADYFRKPRPEPRIRIL